jgi:endonuclease/exonuclease/phosphatase family metal-dependent hydrolase
MAELKFLNFNIRTSLADDGPNNWKLRKDLVIDTIRANDPDLFGIEEPTDEQWAFHNDRLAPEWAGIAHSRRDTVGKEPHLQGLFYRKSRIKPVADGVFWLSDTPDVPGSISFPADWGARTVVWVRGEDLEAKREFVFAVAHLDTHPDSWMPGSRVLAAELKKLAGERPVVVAGDFNCAAGCEAWKYLTGEGGYKDTWTEAGKTDEGVTTFNAFQPIPRLPLENMPMLEKWMHDTCDAVPAFRHYPQHVIDHRNYRIDWILHRGGLSVKDAAVDTRVFNGRTASDHYPVLATLKWPG